MSSPSSTLSDWSGHSFDDVERDGFFRVGTWNIRKALLANSDLAGQKSKLTAVLEFMDQFAVQFMFFQEVQCTLQALRKALPEGLKAYGYEKGLIQVAWIVRKKWAATIRVQGDDEDGRVSVLRLAGKQSSFQTLGGNGGFQGQYMMGELWTARNATCGSWSG